MGYSKNYTKEERREHTLDRGTPKNLSKLSEYLSQENVKAFNAIVTNRMLSKMDERISNMGRPKYFQNIEETKRDIDDYFKLCFDYNMVPTVASFCTFLGCNKDTVYEYINNSASDFSDLLKNAVNTILSFQETGVLSSEIPAVPFIFLGKNYHGFKDNQDITIAKQEETPNNMKTIEAIKEQLSLEKEDTKLLK